MIAFATLFLGLFAGLHSVTVLVGGPVAAVTFQLDGRGVGRLEKPPWTIEIDFGKEFAPHELVARALDRKGEEVARARQWINLPRPPAEVKIVLERSASGQAVAARLAWASLLGPRPDHVTVTFDGRPLPLDEGRRVALPPYDPATTHVVSAELEYPNDLRSRADVVLGGALASDAGSELTGIPISFEAGKGKPPPLEALRGRFRRKGETLTVVAVERGPAEVILVRDLDPGEALQRLGPPESLRLPADTTLGREDRVRILWPVATEVANENASSILFDASREFRRTGFRTLLTRVEYPKRVASPRRFADAVAVAGLQAFASYSRRAVVLVVGSADRDQSLYEPAAVRRYLSRLRVPLSVWSLSPDAARLAAPAWGDVEDISSIAALDRAVERLRRALESQSVVWLEGRYLPQEISLVEKSDGIALER